MTKIRIQKIELALMAAEIEFDGIRTHINLAKNCKLKNTDLHKKIEFACGKIRSARDILRNDAGAKQRTITTRAKSLTKDRPTQQGWEATPKKKLNWKCPYCDLK